MKKQGFPLILLLPVTFVLLAGVSLASVLFAAAFAGGYLLAGSPAGVRLRSKYFHWPHLG